VLIVEDHEITRVGLRLTLEQSAEISIIGEAADGQQGVQETIRLQPNVVLMDIGLPGIDGIEAAGEIKKSAPLTRVIMLTSHDNDRDVFAALGAGADGYCLKETPTSQLALAIKTVSEGAAWLDPGIASRVLRASVQGAATKPENEAPGRSANAPKLSQREIEVLKLVVEGSSNQEIAEKLYLSVETVKTHMRRIMEKLAVSDRTQAAVKAMREGILF
jgi:NarL family two-component system response regulator LiaR